jgi:hypothetical protein
VAWGRDFAARQGMLADVGDRIDLPHRQRPSALVLRRLLGRSATPAPLSTKFVEEPKTANLGCCTTSVTLARLLTSP